MERTPSLRRAIIGLTLLIAATVASYLALQSASDGRSSSAGEEVSSVLVRYSELGGWTGELVKLTVREDGTGSASLESVVNTKKGSSAPIDLSPTELRSIVTSMEDTPLKKTGRDLVKATCMDCNEYTIHYKGSSLKAWRINSIFRAAIKELRGVAKDALKKRPA